MGFVCVGCDSLFFSYCRPMRPCPNIQNRINYAKNMQKSGVNVKQRMSPAQTERRRRTKFLSVFVRK